MNLTKARRMMCVRCWRKLNGSREPVRFIGELSPGERWTPCHLCAGPCDDVPGIFVMMYDSPELRRVDCSKPPA